MTWGVFPGKEIVQPTIVEPGSFKVWKGEAFYLWEEWSRIYSERSNAVELMKHIASTWFLVCVVDSDFIKGDIFKIFA